MVRLMYNDSFTGLPKKNEYRIMSSNTGRKIYTNIENAWLEYTADVKDTSLFDDQFVEALSWKLAAEMAYSLTGNMNIANNCVQAYNAYMVEAAGSDAAEDNMLVPHLDRLALARFGLEV